MNERGTKFFSALFNNGYKNQLEFKNLDTERLLGNNIIPAYRFASSG